MSQQPHRAQDIPASPHSDVELLAACAEGDEQAFERLYDRHVTQVHGLVLRLVQDEQRAEEITREVFVQAWRTAPSHDPSQTVRTWLLTVAHGRAVACLRMQQSDCDATEEQRTPEAEQSALSELPDLEREAIHLAYYEGDTYTEVAEKLETPPQRVKQSIREGLQHLGELADDRPRAIPPRPE